MKYTEATILFSNARLSKYLRACDGDKRKAMQLYRCNARVSQSFFGVVSLFEIILRNAINNHYIVTLGEDWIINQASGGLLLEHDSDEIKKIEHSYRKEGVYSHDKMVGSFTFGFWTYLFTKHNYKVGGKTLLQIFPNRIKGTTQKNVYKDITQIREFRNRIAHHEPICFDKNGAINTDYMNRHYSLIVTYMNYMGVDCQRVLALIERPEMMIKKIEGL